MIKPLKSNRLFNAKTTFALAVCTLLTLSGALFAAEDKNADTSAYGDKSKLSRSDTKFINEAATGGMMEVHMGKLGVQKAQNDQVKQYAQRLIDDHTKANAELRQLASQKGVILPDDKFASDTTDKERSRVRELFSSDRREHAEMRKLDGLSGTDFDREFVRLAVRDHEKDVKEFEKVSEKADDSDVKAFAQKTLPTLREHLQQAKNLQTQVGDSTATK